MVCFADIPLPDAIETADSGCLVGAWAGFWDGVIPHVLVSSDGAPCVYAVGPVPLWGIPAQWAHHKSQVVDDALVLQGPHSTITYWHEGPDVLAGRYETIDGRVTWGRLGRVSHKLLRSATALPRPVWGEAVRIPHVVGPLAGLWHAPKAALSPLAVLSHGSSDGVDPRKTFTMEGEARWLRDQGYAVLVPMRRGRGESDGIYGEAVCCDLHTHMPRPCAAGLNEAMEDLTAAIRFGLAQPGVQPAPVLLAGQSRGGFLSIVYAGLHPTEAAGVISFAGGWTADWCDSGFNTRQLAEAGTKARRPQLWLHADNDSYYSVDHVRTNHTAFTAAGGQAELQMLADLPGDGHGLAAFPGRWTGIAADYLRWLTTAE